LSNVYAEPVTIGRGQTYIDLANAKIRLKGKISEKKLKEIKVKEIDLLKGRKMVDGIRAYLAAGDKVPKNWNEIEKLLKESAITGNDLVRMKEERKKIIDNIKPLDLLKFSKRDLINMVPEGLDAKVEMSMFRAINNIVDGTVYPDEDFSLFADAVNFFKKYMKVEMPELKPVYYKDIMKDLDVATLTENQKKRPEDWKKARERLLTFGVDIASYPDKFGDDLKEAFDVYTEYKKSTERFKDKKSAMNAILDYFNVERGGHKPEVKLVEPVVKVVEKKEWKVNEGVELNEKDSKMIGRLS
jgi:hypothetical protein